MEPSQVYQVLWQAGWQASKQNSAKFKNV